MTADQHGSSISSPEIRRCPGGPAAQPPGIAECPHAFKRAIQLADAEAASAPNVVPIVIPLSSSKKNKINRTVNNEPNETRLERSQEQDSSPSIGIDLASSAAVPTAQPGKSSVVFVPPTIGAPEMEALIAGRDRICVTPASILIEQSPAVDGDAFFGEAEISEDAPASTKRRMRQLNKESERMNNILDEVQNKIQQVWDSVIEFRS